MFADLVQKGKFTTCDSPLSGEVGELFDRILAAIDLTRQEVYICNILKCHLPKNRDPLANEIETCYPHLTHQLSLIKPKIICALGRIAGQILLKEKKPLSGLRKKIYDFKGARLIVTYHPSAMIITPSANRIRQYKRETWEDMKKLRDLYKNQAVRSE